MAISRGIGGRRHPLEGWMPSHLAYPPERLWVSPGGQPFLELVADCFCYSPRVQLPATSRTALTARIILCKSLSNKSLCIHKIVRRSTRCHRCHRCPELV